MNFTIKRMKIVYYYYIINKVLIEIILVREKQ